MTTLYTGRIRPLAGRVEELAETEVCATRHSAARVH